MTNNCHSPPHPVQICKLISGGFLSSDCHKRTRGMRRTYLFSAGKSTSLSQCCASPMVDLARDPVPNSGQADAPWKFKNKTSQPPLRTSPSFSRGCSICRMIPSRHREPKWDQISFSDDTVLMQERGSEYKPMHPFSVTASHMLIK